MLEVIASPNSSSGQRADDTHHRAPHHKIPMMFFGLAPSVQNRNVSAFEPSRSSPQCWTRLKAATATISVRIDEHHAFFQPRWQNQVLFCVSSRGSAGRAAQRSDNTCATSRLVQVLELMRMPVRRSFQTEDLTASSGAHQPSRIQTESKVPTTVIRFSAAPPWRA
jgi:hypothetical protein